MCKLCSWFKLDPLPEIIVPDEKRDKYALLIGINKYQNPENNLRGCVNDAEFLRYKLINDFGFHPDNIRMLLNERATKDAIIKRLHWLVSHEDSVLFGSFSGHGTQCRDRNGDELDMLDEALCPHDMNFDDLFTDDQIGLLLEQTPPSSSLTYLFDCCHSGTINRSILPNPYKKRSRFLPPPRDILARSQGQKLKVKKIGERLVAAPNHIILSGCEDYETSADAWIKGKWQGAFTHFFGKYFFPTYTYNEIYGSMLEGIKNAGYSQTPQFNGKGLNGKILGG